MRTLRETLSDGLADLRIAVALHHGTVAVVEIVVFVAVHIPQLGTAAVIDVVNV